MRIKVDNEDIFPGGGKSGREIDRGRGFADPAFLICNCQYPWRMRLNGRDSPGGGVCPALATLADRGFGVFGIGCFTISVVGTARER